MKASSSLSFQENKQTPPPPPPTPPKVFGTTAIPLPLPPSLQAHFLNSPLYYRQDVDGDVGRRRPVRSFAIRLLEKEKLFD